MASQVDATRSPSSKISSVQPWQKTPPQERTQPVEARVLTPQVGQVIAMREETPRTRGDDLIRCQRKTRRLGGIKAHNTLCRRGRASGAIWARLERNRGPADP